MLDAGMPDALCLMLAMGLDVMCAMVVARLTKGCNDGWTVCGCQYFDEEYGVPTLQATRVDHASIPES